MTDSERLREIAEKLKKERPYQAFVCLQIADKLEKQELTVREVVEWLDDDVEFIISGDSVWGTYGAKDGIPIEPITGDTLEELTKKIKEQ